MKSAHLSAPSHSIPGFIPGCPFCTIDPNRTTVVQEFALTRAVLSNPRLAPGHLLLIPIRHVQRLSELEHEELDELVSLLIRYQELIFRKFTPGCDIRQNYHPFEPEGDIKVDHLHMHLIPRSYNDEFYRSVHTVEDALFQLITPVEKERFYDLYHNLE